MARGQRRNSLSRAQSGDSHDHGTHRSDEGANGDQTTPKKRRKISCDAFGQSVDITLHVEEEIEVRLDASADQPPAEPTSTSTDGSGPTEAAEIAVCTQVSDQSYFSTPRSSRLPTTAPQLDTSTLSSPDHIDQVDLVPLSDLRQLRRPRLDEMPPPPTSSPLSSPPPVLFDPFDSSSPASSPGHHSSSSVSAPDLDYEEAAMPRAATSGRSILPAMKGKDLFDASIWADPLRTSVFYTFATSLRQKIKSVEPTTSHRFISHLRDRGKLVRCYTQNIDQIEEKVGLSTSLHEGPGHRARFSRRSTLFSTASQDKQIEEQSEPVNSESSSSQGTSQASNQSSQQSENDPSEGLSGRQLRPSPQPGRKSPHGGVECVFLHGSLELLRCFLCGRVCSWDDSKLEMETLSGQQPECPHCVGATVAREERGKRALGVGKLRPDIVLYGEEHPNAHLISPIVTHDLSLYPDMLLILGTSLRVHGLKVMIREFAKTVHSKGGKVVFVNFTKPPESSWGDVIDYWIEWDCDAWVDDLQTRAPKLWQDLDQVPPRRKKRRDSSGSGPADGRAKVKKLRPPPAYPMAVRDTKVTGAYWTLKITEELHRITGTASSRPRIFSTKASKSGSAVTGKTARRHTAAQGKPRRPRKSARKAPDRPNEPAPAPNGSLSRSSDGHEPFPTSQSSASTATTPCGLRDSTVLPNVMSIIDGADSLVHSVKLNPRVRKRRKIDGEEVQMPKVGTHRSTVKFNDHSLKLPPLAPQPPSTRLLNFGWRPQPVEPRSLPEAPLMFISANIRSANVFGRSHAFYFDDPLTKGLGWPALYGARKRQSGAELQQPGQRWANAELTGPRADQENRPVTSPAALDQEAPMLGAGVSPQDGGDGNDRLRRWGSTWNCLE